MLTEVPFQSTLNRQQSSIILSLIGIYLPLQIFALLAIAVIQNGAGLRWDVALLSAIHNTATPQLDIFASVLTQLGYLKGLIPIISLLSIVFIAYRQWHRLAYLLTAEFGAMLISYSVKLVFHRARPHLWQLFQPLPLDYSFPSGHSLMSMILFVALLHLAWGTRWYKWVIIIGGLFVVGIGWTRLYLGVHYPSDVLGGWMLAIAWGIGLNQIFQSSFVKLIARKQADL